ncbi:hypothetical protein OG730_41600 (plasmid) [Streptomyces sp. NBC_01298]|uniref:hypothetical protein n=1 Tax=Streptomyces sp. NBC_01298 TaxID=2903817 RepID=UPI002E1364F7|nr:hypothetical protein OG730_41600 [Streptomyces sp. NBC_01298]
MLTALLRSLSARLVAAPLRTEFYQCDQCGLRAWITNHPDRIAPLLAAVKDHRCEPKRKSKSL